MDVKPEKPTLLDGQLDRAIDPQYAAISPSAVIGLALGVLGVMGLWILPLTVFSVIGLIVSALAARKIRRSEGVLTGRRIAKVGMLVGAVVTLGAVAYHGEAEWSEWRLLKNLEARTNEVVSDVLDGRYEAAYNRIAPAFRQRYGGSADGLRRELEPVFKGAGAVVKRTIVSLPPPMSV
ncbi:MAG: DUF4190 domain-containing protein, partial [Planctomycetota bacterium]|nr:DUF4190 domain-containing protein [Planctomycetota bacterium]